jgi:GT2 family glycosyltransferase
LRASIIIPSWNARERLYLNLVALNNQDYQGDDVEIIVVDNGSKDRTMDMLKDFKSRFPLRTLRLEENRGIARGRNQGILEARGDILIFHDSDMIASRDFVRKHIQAHEKGSDLVVCGLFWKRIFSFFYKRFSHEQMARFERITGNKLEPGNPPQDRMPLITEADVLNGSYEKYSFDLDLPFIVDLKQVLKRYGNSLEGYNLPWRFFITNNLSVPRDRVMGVGMLDEGIVRYGYEDYDLGVRLFKDGCRFVMAEDIMSCHQEHPANFTWVDVVENVTYICEKYNHIYFLDMQMVCLQEALKTDSDRINLVAGDIHKLLAEKESHQILRVFLELLNIIRRSYYKPYKGPSSDVIINIADNIPLIIRQTRQWVEAGKAVHFIGMLRNLLKITLNIELGPKIGLYI